MRHGVIVLLDAPAPEEPPLVIAGSAIRAVPTWRTWIRTACRTSLVGDLGVFFPSHVDQGQVVWLRGRGQGQFETIVLWDGLGLVNESVPRTWTATGTWTFYGRVALADRGHRVLRSNPRASCGRPVLMAIFMTIHRMSEGKSTGRPLG